MPTLTSTKLLDLVATTLPSIDTPQWSQIAQQLQEYEAMPRIFKKDMKTQKGGVGAQWQAMYRTGGAARRTGIYDVDVISRVNKWAQLTAQFVMRDTSWSISRHELLANVDAKKPEKLVDLLEGEEHAAMLDMAQLLEEDWFGTPDATDEKAMRGLFYYLVRGATDGFTGQNPAGFSDVAGLDSSLSKYANWRNYSFRYLALTRASAIKWMRRATRQTKWKSPTNVGSFRKFAGQKRRIMMNQDTLEAFEDAAQDQNDQLGPDVARYDGEATFKRMPLVYVHFLDADTTNPIIGCDYDVLEPVALEGDLFYRHDPAWLTGLMHNTMACWIDLSVLIKCYDRRRLWIGFQDAGADM